MLELPRVEYSVKKNTKNFHSATPIYFMSCVKQILVVKVFSLFVDSRRNYNNFVKEFFLFI